MNATLLTITLAALSASDSEDLTVLEDSKAASRMVYEHLAEQAHEALDRRREAYEQLETVEECRDWQKRRREFFVRQLGGFPDKTPLNAEVAGTLEGDGYRVEKIFFESRPRHHVTAALYLPEGDPPYPAVLIASGHSRTAKAAGYNQRMGILLAKNGLAALAYDPIGQGERSQILTGDGEPKYGGTTTEHFMMGVGAILVGTNTAQYRIYDGMRAIDYLETRPDIDAERIGCTGCSGGGTLTSYLMALDDRIRCAAPACYLTTFRRLIDTIGPQDAEQNVFGQVTFGMDQPDYVLMRAPRPTLICATTGDFFDIEGTWDNYRQAKRFYARFGEPERVALVEDDSRHGITQLNRETMVRWMKRWLLGVDEAVSEPDFPVHEVEELHCTSEGQVLRLPDERSVYDLNVQCAERLAKQRRRFWKEHSEAEIRQKIRETAGVRPLKDLPPVEHRVTGRLERDGYTIEKLILQPEEGLRLPALAFVPDDANGKATLYLHSNGKHADAGADGPIAKRVAQGNLVLAVDVRGFGETQSGERSRGPIGPNWKEFYLAYLLGRSLVGLRTEDVLTSARFLAGYKTDAAQRKVDLVGIGKAGVPALHAAALEPDRFVRVRLRRTLVSWTDVVRTPEAQQQLGNTVHGALRVYDLPDLIELCGAEQVSVNRSVDASGEPVADSGSAGTK